MKLLKYWIEAMRLRTLPVSLAGVILAMALAIMKGQFDATPAILCLIFALLAQIASNFANEYYDFKAGLDKKGREGPRRGVTEGDITPQAMKTATYATLAMACAVGCSLIAYGGWWLIIVGVFIAIGVIAYSTGPFPLSHHGLGEVAVILFFGIIPVNLTYYVMTLDWDIYIFISSISAGLMGANVLIVNNYRDEHDDKMVNKYTLTVLIGRTASSTIYAFNGYIAVAIMTPLWFSFSWWALIFPLIYLGLHTLLWFKMLSRYGHELNKILGATAILMFFYCASFLITVAYM